MMPYLMFHNIVLAVTWCLLQEKFTLVEFVLGFLYGYGILYALRTVLDDKKDQRRTLTTGDYFSLTAKSLGYFIVFLSELIKANLEVVRIVLSPELKMRPGIIAYKLNVKTDAGITLLANSITLTPGTLSVDLSEDRKTLYIHALHMEDADELEQSIRNSLETYTKEILG
jgi:multicomponent Na+:H+ antiporter subunit E